MATGRMLKRNISESRRLSELKTDSARLLWTWIIPYLDADGRFFASATMIKGKVVPRLATFTLRNIPRYLKDMADVGLITLYEVDGEKILEYRKFSEFQKIIKDREARSLPASPKGKELPIKSRPSPDKVVTKSGEHKSNLIESNLIESKAKGDREEGPVDNLKEKEPPKPSTFSQDFADRIIIIREKFKSPSIEAAVVLFVTAHSKNAPLEEMIYCLDQFIKYGHGIDTLKIKIYLEKILLKRVQNRNEAEYLKEHKDDKGTKEGDKAAMENLGSILKHMAASELKPIPEKSLCLKCNNSYLPSLMENGTCCFCNPGVVTIQCPQCTRTVGKNILDRTTGVCIHCKPKTT